MKAAGVVPVMQKPIADARISAFLDKRTKWMEQRRKDQSRLKRQLENVCSRADAYWREQTSLVLPAEIAQSLRAEYRRLRDAGAPPSVCRQEWLRQAAEKKVDLAKLFAIRRARNTERLGLSPSLASHTERRSLSPSLASHAVLPGLSGMRLGTAEPMSHTGTPKCTSFGVEVGWKEDWIPKMEALSWFEYEIASTEKGPAADKWANTSFLDTDEHVAGGELRVECWDVDDEAFAENYIEQSWLFLVPTGDGFPQVEA